MERDGGDYRLVITDQNVRSFIAKTLGLVLIKFNRSQRHSYYHWLLSDALSEKTKFEIMENLRLPNGSGTIGWVAKRGQQSTDSKSINGFVIFNSFLDPLGQVAAEDWRSGARSVYAIPLYGQKSEYVASLFFFSPLEGLFCKLAAQQDGANGRFSQIPSINQVLASRVEYLLTALQLEEHDQLGRELRRELDRDAKNAPDDDLGNREDPASELLFQLRSSGSAVDDLSLFQFAFIRNDYESRTCFLSVNATAWIQETRKSLDEHFSKGAVLGDAGFEETINNELETALGGNTLLAAITRNNGPITYPMLQEGNLIIAFVCCGKTEGEPRPECSDSLFLKMLSSAFRQLVKARNNLGRGSANRSPGESKKLLSDAIYTLANWAAGLFLIGAAGEADATQLNLDYVQEIISLVSAMPDTNDDVRNLLVQDQHGDAESGQESALSAIKSIIGKLSQQRERQSLIQWKNVRLSNILGCALLFVGPGFSCTVDTNRSATSEQIKHFVSFVNLLDPGTREAKANAAKMPMREVYPSDEGSRLVGDFAEFLPNGNVVLKDKLLTCHRKELVVHFFGVSFSPIALDRQIAALVVGAADVEGELRKLDLLERGVEYASEQRKVGFRRTLIAHFEKRMSSPFESVMRMSKLEREYRRFSPAITNALIGFDHIRGNDEEDSYLKHSIGRSLLPLLLTGRTGAGKSFLAAQVHNWIKDECFPLNDEANARFEEIGCSGLDRTQFVIDLHGLVRQTDQGSDVNLGAAFRLAGLQEVHGSEVPANFEDYIKLSIKQSRKGMKLVLDNSKKYFFLQWAAPGGEKVFRSDETPVGTIYLSGVTDLSWETQGVLLRFLDTNLVRPLGWAGRPFCIRTRIISSTNKEDVLVDGRQFRNDLYHRLSVWQQRLSPVSARLNHFGSIADKVIADENVRMALLGHAPITCDISIGEILADLFVSVGTSQVTAPYDQINRDHFKDSIEKGDAAYLTNIVKRAFWSAVGRSAANIMPQDLVQAINHPHGNPREPLT